MKRLSYILGGLISVFLLVLLGMQLNSNLKKNEQEKAQVKTEQYLAENFQGEKFEIRDISSSTDFKHYGYFEHEATVRNKEIGETFTLYYDKNMD
ncbi:hypothetical protein [Ureibacillus sinduriensis]|uniref:DUF3139 domain-containing protein n=1 Tax=Ureibacillus sinduriensis BLB-1 = JCM 15800 TaxID=1384057 RepID=A0A0A3IHI9_9BACL|nr:hypothetical protein [Ureibacillus sinduriensis]KGR74282.1 hypothetical protein CD33_20100 [Ureibacillus sinduriensis BLB-1 = JCM 15800]